MSLMNMFQMKENTGIIKGAIRITQTNRNLKEQPKSKMKRVICGDEVQEVLEIWVRKIWTSEAAVRSCSSK